MLAPAGPPLPTVVQTLLWFRKPIEFMRSCTERYGDLYRMKIARLGSVAMTNNPEFVRQIFSGKDEVMRGGEVASLVLPIVGEQSIFLQDGAKFVRMRRLMMAPFHGERMRLYGHVMRDLTLERVATWRDGDVFSLRR